MSNSVSPSIPVVDLREFWTGSDYSQNIFVQTIGQALEEIGFFAVINHGVDFQLVNRAYALAQAFFELPEDVKLRYEEPALHGQRGFTRFGREHAKDHSVPDLKEFWHMGREETLANLQPIEVPEFHAIMSQLYGQLEACGATLLEACALYLGEPRSSLRSSTEGGDTILRVIHYPPIPADAHPASLRAAPHEDINLITLLCEATASGLELLTRDGNWLAVPPLQNQIIVDSGDMLQHLTNGLFKSTTHRVTNPDNSHARRFSMPFFVHPNGEMDLTPLASCVEKTGGAAKFPPITAEEYLQQRLREIGLSSGSSSQGS